MKALTITIFCVDSNLPKKIKIKNKTIVGFYSWYRCKEGACSPKELPRIPIFCMGFEVNEFF
jgi:hypothetical protein